MLLIIQFVIFQYAVNEHMSRMGINITFKLYNWLTFFIIGGILKKYNLEYKNWILPVLLIITNFFFQSYEKNYLPQVEFYYSSLPLLVLVISIFLFIKSINCTRLQTIIKHLSKLFLLVYSTHLLIMRYVPSNLFGEGAFSPLIYFFTIAILAVAFSFCITKIPFLNKILSL